MPRYPRRVGLLLAARRHCAWLPGSPSEGLSGVLRGQAAPCAAMLRRARATQRAAFAPLPLRPRYPTRRGASAALVPSVLHAASLRMCCIAVIGASGVQAHSYERSVPLATPTPRCTVAVCRGPRLGH